MSDDPESEPRPTKSPTPDDAKPDIEADQAGIGGPDIRVDEGGGIGAPDIKPER